MRFERTRFAAATLLTTAGMAFLGSQVLETPSTQEERVEQQLKDVGMKVLKLDLNIVSYDAEVLWGKVKQDCQGSTNDEVVVCETVTHSFTPIEV